MITDDVKLAKRIQELETQVMQLKQRDLESNGLLK